MTITNDPSTTSIHQRHDPPLDQEGEDRSDKQSPNRAGIPMPGDARLHSAHSAGAPCAMPQIGLFASDREVF